MPSLFAVGFRRLARLLGVFCVLTLLAACSQSPESVAKDFFEAVADNRTEEAVGYISLENVKENNLTAAKGKFMMLVGEQYSRIQANDGLDSVSTALVDEKDGTARVTVAMKYKNGKTAEDRLTLIKEKKSGKWKIEIK